MHKNSFARSFARRLPILPSLSLVFFSFTAFAQKTEQKKEKKGRDPVEAYKSWIDDDVRYLITDPEREIFRKQKTDEEREQFIEQFWLRRDPDPDATENEFARSTGGALLTQTSTSPVASPGGRPTAGASTSSLARRTKRNRTQRVKIRSARRSGLILN